MKVFLGIGECMVELSPAGQSLWKQGFAGDVFNTLWYARAMLGDEWQVRFHTAVGIDPISDDLIAFAETAGIGCGDVPRVPNRVPGLYTIHLDGAERSFTYWRDTSAARALMADRGRALRAIQAADVICFSGITLAILPVQDATALIGMLDDARRAGKIVAFDPNIRPRLWPDIAAMRDVIHRAARVSSVLLPSFDDEAQAFGDTSPAATVRRYEAAGCRHVVVKDGLRPTTVAIDGDVQTYPVTAQGKVVDTTAAGDSFNGAYLANIAQARDSAVAVRAAQACSAQVVGARGALVAL